MDHTLCKQILHADIMLPHKSIFHVVIIMELLMDFNVWCGKHNLPALCYSIALMLSPAAVAAKPVT